MARPKLSLNVVQIKKLAEIQCTMSEIASVMDCSVQTLENSYLDIIKGAREGGEVRAGIEAASCHPRPEHLGGIETQSDDSKGSGH